MIKASEYPEIERMIMDKSIPTFRTRKDAQEAGKSIGWGNSSYAVRFERRFEIIWILAQFFIGHDDCILPLFHWETVNGMQQMKTARAFKRV